jgi:hypothetical protein
MKTPTTKFATVANQTPVFPKTPHRLRPDPKPVGQNAKPEKHDQMFQATKEVTKKRNARDLSFNRPNTNTLEESMTFNVYRLMWTRRKLASLNSR